MSLTKIEAATLFAYGFKLVDKEGKQYDIVSIYGGKVMSERMGVDSNGEYRVVFFDQIGTDYHVLVRPLSDLTKEITHDGKKIVPIIELAKLVFEYDTWRVEDNKCVSNRFDFSLSHNKKSFQIIYRNSLRGSLNQCGEDVYQTLHSYYFYPSLNPELTKPLEV